MVEGVLPLAAREDLGALFHGLLDPGIDPFQRVVVDQRADVDRGVERIADLQGLDLLDEPGHEVLVHLGLDEDTLHRDAGLPRLVVPAHGDPRRGMVQVGVGMDDDPGVAPELEGGVLVRIEALQLPPDPRAREGELLEPPVLHQLLGPLAGDRQDREHPLGQFGLVEQLGKGQGAERRYPGRLHHDGGAHGQGRSHLVGHQVDREIERADRQDRPIGEPADDPCPRSERLLGVQRKELPAEPPGLLGGPPESGYGPGDLDL